MRQAFIGRADVLDLLRDRYRKAQCGDGSAMILRGEPGIGKTRLVEHFLDEVRAGDPNVVATVALDYAASPYAPIVTIIETWLRDRPGLFTVHGGLRAAVDCIVAADAQTAIPSAAERRRCFDSVANLFRIACADAPTTVVIDDVQHADPATLHLLYHIVAATRRSAFLLIATTRTDRAADRAGSSPLLRLERLENVVSATVEPMSDDLCDTLIATAANGLVGRDVRRLIRERAEGNPLFAEELVRQMLTTGLDPAAGVPATVAGTVLERFSLLAPDHRETLYFAAAIGRTFAGTLLARLTGRDIADVLAIVRQAVAFGLVTETADSDRFRFRHAMTRDAVYSQLLQAEREAMHRRIFEALRDRTGDVDTIAALAFHAHASGDRESTAYYNELAGDHAAGNQAFETAIVAYERARCAVPERGPEAARICQKLSTGYLLAGFPDRAVAPVQTALAYFRAARDAGAIAGALMQLADIAGHAGEDERRLEYLAEARDALAETRDPLLQAKRSLCAFEVAIADRDVDGIIAGCDDLVDSGTIDVPVAIALRNASAHALLMQRRYRAAVAAQAHAVRLAATSGNPEHLSSSHFALGVIFALSGEIAHAGASFGEAAAIARSRWATTESAIGLAFQAESELMRGHICRARQLLDEALADARRSDHPMLITMMGRVGIFLGLRTGDRGLVRDVVEALDLEALFRNRTPERYFALSGAFAQFLATEQRHGEASAILQRAVARLSVKRLRSTDWSPCTMMTIAAMGDEAIIPAARVPIDEWFAPYAPAFVHLFDALVAERFGDATEAARHAQLAVPDFHSYEFRFEEAMALELSGQKRQALEVFEHFGARETVERLRNELTPKNRHGRARNVLTPRERDVAALVASGLTNREIADRLSVTEKTTETHLASIFAKLGVRSRNDVAAHVAVPSS